MVKPMKNAHATVLTCVLLCACTTGDTFEVQVLEICDVADSSTVYYSDRDIGFSARLSGTSSADGSVKTRDLWTFGDSGGYEADGNPFSGTFGFATNTAALVAPKPLGAIPPVNPMPSAVIKDANGPMMFRGFIGGGTGYPTCVPAEEYAAQWISSVIRLPDSDPRHETALVFYQNWCVAWAGPYTAFDGGVAVMTWDADAPDDPPTATVLNDRLFAPGRFINQWIPNGLEKSAAYGQAAYFKPGASNELVVLQCGNASHCTAAHWFYDTAKTVQQNLDSVSRRSSWSYRVEGATTSASDDAWLPLPPSDETPDDDCTPTSDEACAPATTYPVAKRVLTASSDPLAQVWGAPSIAVLGTNLVIAYTPGPVSGSHLLKVDHAAIRMGGADGIFGTPVQANLPGGRCTPLEQKGCYAPVLHTELDHDGWFYFSYYARGDLTLPGGITIGQLHMGRTCLGEFLGKSC
jgi:hypothetical protein